MEKITFESNLEPLVGPSPKQNQVQEGQNKSFGETLNGALNEVNALKREADQAVKDLATGGGNIHETMIAMEKASISFQLMMQVRNKVITAYETIMRTTV